MDRTALGRRLASKRPMLVCWTIYLAIVMCPIWGRPLIQCSIFYCCGSSTILCWAWGIAVYARYRYCQIWNEIGIEWYSRFYVNRSKCGELWLHSVYIHNSVQCISAFISQLRPLAYAEQFVQILICAIHKLFGFVTMTNRTYCRLCYLLSGNEHINNYQGNIHDHEHSMRWLNANYNVFHLSSSIGLVGTAFFTEPNNYIFYKPDANIFFLEYYVWFGTLPPE